MTETDNQLNIESKETPDFSRKVKRALEVTSIAFLLGLGVEILFYSHPLGINFPIWAALTAVALFITARLEGVQPSRWEWLLVIPILFLSGMAAMRLEPLTVFLSVVGTWMLFALWVWVFRTGRLINFGWLDFAIAVIVPPLEALFRPWATMTEAWRRAAGERGGGSRGWAILRGVLLALPVLAIFTALLAAADLVFGDLVEEALRWLNIEKLLEWVGRGVVIVLSAIFMLGALVAALLDPGKRTLQGEDKPLLKPFVGFLESMIVLGAVDLLFALFVVVQFRYLFGGEANITAAGYTYADYARNGFGELVWVAFLGMGLIMALGYFGKRGESRQRSWFNGLSTGLVVMLGVILVSAWQRLLLYEGAYGFTELRTYTHVFIPWLALHLVVFLILLFRGNLRRFAPFAALGTLGFVVTLNLLNVDAFIVRQNVKRFEQTGEIDLVYLQYLSDDAVPGLVEFAQVAPEGMREELLASLACRRAMQGDRQEDLDWPSWHASHKRAMTLLDELAALDAYTVEFEDWNWMVSGPGVEKDYCDYWYWD
ncbi:MAG: DUF4173 domain-containing protein [Anaerolineales bacterium]|nr:MAG: DUF4173 domain-containing protein [Anaerolineales bacterium]